MSASRFQKSRGGKHGIPRCYLQMEKGEFRLVILLRVVREENVLAAERHWQDCGNRDYRCWCLNADIDESADEIGDDSSDWLDDSEEDDDDEKQSD